MKHDIDANGRWCGGWYRWDCGGCGSVLESKRPPGEGEATCAGCRAIASIEGSAKAVRELMTDRDEWKAKARRLERELDETYDRLNEMIQGASTEPAPEHTPEPAEGSA